MVFLIYFRFELAFSQAIQTIPPRTLKPIPVQNIVQLLTTNAYVEIIEAEMIMKVPVQAAGVWPWLSFDINYFSLIKFMLLA